MTALFADISGFTPLAGRLDPEELVDLIDPIIAVMSGAVRRFGGYVDKYAGDALLALFGAPVSHEHDAVLALHAALAMRRLVDESSRGGPDAAAVTLHMGVNSGHAVGRVLARETGSDYAVLGEAVILAQRLESVAPPGEIYVSESTYRLARREFSFESVGELTLKGRDEPVRAWRLIAARSQPPRAPASTPFVGRRRELDGLVAVLDGLAAGAGAAVSVTGEPGVGKSRLAAAVREQADVRGVRWLQASCPSYGAGVAYGPYTELVRQLAGIEADLAPDEAIARLEAAAGLRDADAVQVLSPLLGLDRREAAARMEPGALRTRLHMVLVRWVRSEADRRPLALVVEDLHWADAASLALTRELAKACRDAPLLLYVTGRVEAAGALAAIRDRAGRSHVVELRPLPPVDIESVVRAVLGEHASSDLARRLTERAAGNPFFAEELARSSSETPVSGHDEDDVAGAVPPTIEQALSARMDLLRPRDVGVLQTAAVIGRRVRLSLLQAVVGDRDNLDGVLDRLIDGNFLDETEDTDIVVFHHTLVQEVAYARLLRRQRVELHGKVGHAAVGLLGDGDGTVDFLARHFYLAGSGAEAVEHLVRAAERAQRLFANEEAITSFERALERLEGAQPPAEHDDRRHRMMAVRIGTGRGTVLHHLGRLAEAREAYRHGLAEAGPGPDPGRARLERLIAKTLAAEHRWDEAIVGYDRAEAYLDATPHTARQPDWWHERIQVGLDRWTVDYWTGRMAEMTERAVALRPLVEQHGTATHRSAFFSSLLTMQLRRHRYGSWPGRAADVRALLSASSETRDPGQIAAAAFNVALAQLCTHELEPSSRHLADALRTAEEIGSSDVRIKCLTYRVVLERMRGDVIATERTAHDALDALASAGPPTYAAMAQANLAWVEWRRGRVREATALGQAGLDVWEREADAYPFKWAALFPLFAVASADGDPARAADLARTLLDTGQQVLPTDLDAALTAVVTAADRREPLLPRALERAVDLARAHGYL